ncbi:hypothetical protein ACFL6H_04890 [Candidatus Latescibacterota bacterium]
MQTNSEKSYIILTMIFRQEKDLWTGVCKELGTAADGDTFDEVAEALREMVSIHLNTLEDVGECKRFLKEHGIRIYHKAPQKFNNISIPNDSKQYINRQLIPIGIC